VPYDSIVNRADADALMPEEVSQAFRRNLTNESAVLNRFTRVPVGSAQARFPVLSALPIAYWVTGDTGLKQTSDAAWANKFLNIEELAVIVPIPEAVIDDAGFPIWDEVRPLCEQAGGRLLDSTVFFGTNAPATFPTNVVAASVAADNVVARGANAQAAGGYVQDVGDLMGLIEDDGYDAISAIAKRSVRGLARKARNSDGNRYDEVSISRDTVEIDSLEITFPMRGQWPSGVTVAELVAFDPAEFVVGVRQDVTWKLLDQAVIQDAAGAIVYNLAQQDMVAMRMVMRVGWQVANTINYDAPTEASRYPAGVLRTPAA
jgi:HK97 family phage major capsid protein